MLNKSCHYNKVTLSRDIMIQRFDKGLLRFSFNLYSLKNPLWIHIGTSFEAGDYLKYLLSTTDLTVSIYSLMNLVLEAGFKFPLDRVINIEDSDYNESFFECIDSYLWNRKPDFYEEDLYLTYQITYDVKERYDKYIKENPSPDPYDEMFTILTDSDITYYNVVNGSFSEERINNC
jgi:hypothetical protein